MDRLKILMELRPAGEGFAGIPQETRILFSEMTKADAFDVCGLLNYNRFWAGGDLDNAAKDSGSTQDKLYHQSKAVLALSSSAEGIFAVAERAYHRFSQPTRLRAMRALGQSIEVHDLEMRPFADFVWRSYFSKSLSASDFDRVTQANFAAIKPSWAAMQRVGASLLGRGTYVRMDTSKYDVYLSQTPWPARISPSTQLVVRFHDAIPIFYPHTIHNSTWHQFTHYYPLRSNLKQGAILVCNSENSRNEVLQMFPQAEVQTRVIPCIVSDDYFPEASTRETQCDIVRTRIEPDTEPEFLGASERTLFYERHLDPGNFRYIMMVSTIEPRKNHSRLIAAWNLIRTSVDPDLKLIIVGRPGWSNSEVISSMKAFQERGMLFNVSRASSAELRRLYGGSEAVVCPSIAEGFDLSGIEAMLAGGAVAASDIPVHREIYKDACEYFSPYSTRQTADAILKIIDGKNAENRARLVATGAKVGQEYKRSKIGPMWEQFFGELQPCFRKRSR